MVACEGGGCGGGAEEAVHRESAAGDVTAFGHSKGEIETIDLYSRLVEEIRWVDVQLTAPTAPGPGSRWRTDKPGVPPKKEVRRVGQEYAHDGINGRCGYDREEVEGAEE